MKRGLLLFLLILPIISASECDNWHSEHPEWLICEDFEDYQGDFIQWYDASDWYSQVASDRGRIDISNSSFQGDFALYMPAAESSGYKGADLRWYDCIGEHQRPCEMNGHDQLYLRAYFRLAPDHEYVHHFLNIAGSQPDRETFWDSMGTAGCRPNGILGAGTTVDFNENMESHFYTYSIDMTCDPGWSCDRYNDASSICDACDKKGLPCLNGEECCWGNHYPKDPGPEAVLPKNEWVCIEMTMKLNTPEQKDGYMAYWLNGELIHEQSGMYWRISPTLQLNKINVQHYIDSGEADQPNRIWWDNVVLSTERIGCLDYVPVARCTDADTDSSGIISNNEMLGFVNQWKLGSQSITNLMNAIDKWKHGC